MADKTYIREGETAPDSQIGATLEALSATIQSRKDTDEKSYTYRLLSDGEDALLMKVIEEAGEVVLAAKDGNADHLRYEAADLLYHLLVVLERHDIALDEFAAELNMRMKEGEQPEGAVRLFEEYVNRGK